MIIPARPSCAASTNSPTRVKVTASGREGRNVVLEKKFGGPTITKDGVTVAKEIELKDPLENMGAQMVREEWRSKTSGCGGQTWNDHAATILAQAIFREGVKAVTAVPNPMAIWSCGIEQGRGVLD